MGRLPLRLLIAACLLGSGAAGLLYEVAWLRLLGLRFGQTTLAITAVLTAFMVGLALGSWLLGRRAARLANPVRAYALLEAALGTYAALTPWLFGSAGVAYGALEQRLAPGNALATAVQLLLAAALLLPATVLMGATLPVLSRAVTGPTERSAARAGALYALNTCGAVGGVVLAGYLLLPTIGVRATIFAGAALNFLIAAAAFVASRASIADSVSIAPACKAASTADGSTARATTGHGPIAATSSIARAAANVVDATAATTPAAATAARRESEALVADASAAHPVAATVAATPDTAARRESEALAADASAAHSVAASATATPDTAARPASAPIACGLPDTAPAPIDPAPRSRPVVLLALFGIALSGAAAMTYEVAWTRALALILGSSTYAFSAMLATFLVGLALGAGLFTVRLRRSAAGGPAAPSTLESRGLTVFGLLEVGAGFAALLMLPLFDLLPALVLEHLWRSGLSHGAALAGQVGASAAIMLLPAMLLGATFPCVVQIVAGAPRDLGRDVGSVYAANTLGSIVGAAAAGLLLIPSVGVRNAIVAAAAINVLTGVAAFALAPGSSPRRRLAAAAIAASFAAAVTILPSWNALLMGSGAATYAASIPRARTAQDAIERNSAGRELLFFEEGINTTVAVERNATGTYLRVNGKVDASSGTDMMTQLLLGHLGALVNPEARRALVIGLGSGVTAGALAQHPLERIDVAELEPAVVTAASYFERENRGALRDPRVHVITGDGRRLVESCAQPYDLIVSEPSNPWMAGVGNLFTREFYRAAAAALSPRGIFVQWAHGYGLRDAELKMIVATLRSAFPETTVWRSTRGDYLLLGARQPLELDYPAMQRRFASSPGLREDFQRFRWSSAAAVLNLFLLSAQDAARFAANAPLNTDDLPLLEFAAPRALYLQTALDQNHRLLLSFRTARSPAVRGLPDSQLEADPLAAARTYWALGASQESALELAAMTRAETLPGAQQLERGRLLLALGRVHHARGVFERLAPQDTGAAHHLRAASALLALPHALNRAAQVSVAKGLGDPVALHNEQGAFYLSLGVETGEASLLALAAGHFEDALRLAPDDPRAARSLADAKARLLSVAAPAP